MCSNRVRMSSPKKIGRPKGRPKCLIYLEYFGAGEMNRTPDLLITNELLYRLSYTGLVCGIKPEIIARRFYGSGNR